MIICIFQRYCNYYTILYNNDYSVVQGECTRVDGINDKTDFLLIQKALGVLGFSESEMEVSYNYNELKALMVKFVLYIRAFGLLLELFCIWEISHLKLMMRDMLHLHLPMVTMEI